MGQGAFIIKEIGCNLALSAAVVHGNERGCYLLADIGLCKSSVLNEHIHFNAVTERFMNDHARDFWCADAFISAGFHGFGVQKIRNGLYALRNCRLHFIKQLRTAEVGESAEALLDFLTLCRNKSHDAR